MKKIGAVLLFFESPQMVGRLLIISLLHTIALAHLGHVVKGQSGPVVITDTTPKINNIATEQRPVRIYVGNIELHYIEEGQGEPLILLHGGQGDFRAWSKQIEAFAPLYRVISYSRRYHYPNNNPLQTSEHSALIEATDLAGLINLLKLGPVHLVGTSYGAYTALAFAIDHPELVRSMVLAEPPVLQWAKNTPRGSELYQDFMSNVHAPAGKAFAADDPEGAMRIFINRFDGEGAFDKLPLERRKIVMENARFFQAITSSSDPFPNLPKSKVARLNMPVMIVRGENTKELDIIVADELSRIIPKAQKAIIPQAGHGSPRQNPDGFNKVVLEFLKKNSADRQ